MSESNCNQTESAIIVGKEAAGAEPRRFEVEGIPMILVDDDQGAMVMSEAINLADLRAPGPRRRKGTSRHAELDSFCEYVNRFKCDDSVVWSDVEAMQLCAQLNYHPGGPKPDSTGWGDHRALYLCPPSPQWRKWSEMHDRTMNQVAFAEFIDENLHDLAGGKGTEYPEPMTVLEMARKLQVHTKGTYKRTIHPTTGDHELVCTQETESSSTPIPRAFQIGIPVFEGGEVWSIEVRIMLRVRDGQALFTLQPHRMPDILREAFGEVRDKAETAVELPVFSGTPEG